ncbi:MAG: ATP-binding protein [Acidobacteriota bacterium]
MKSILPIGLSPFDDRRALGAELADLQIMLARQFLREVRSDLFDDPVAERIYSAMRLVRRDNGHHAPRNVALLFFAEEPSRWFRGAVIEAAVFADGAGGETIEEQRFTGPLPFQLRQALTWLEGRSVRRIEKQATRPEARAWVSYPALALREALVNAVYHRSYEDSVEPTKVYVYPDRIEVISYPGPVDGLEAEHFASDAAVPPVPARNRRIGELLKELRLAESRGTGVPKIRRAMHDNGSPPPRFDFDHARSYFRVTLPVYRGD